MQIIQRYEASRYVKDLSITPCFKSANDKETEFTVLLVIEENLQVFSRQLAIGHDIAKTSVGNIFKSEKLKP